MRRLLSQIFVVYVAMNTLVASIVFFWWARPRETISGLIGRWYMTESGWKRKFSRAVCPVVNKLYAWEPNHCVVTHDVEAQAHNVLYPELLRRVEKKSNGLLHP
jgi:hypothetical protein